MSDLDFVKKDTGGNLTYISFDKITCFTIKKIGKHGTHMSTPDNDLEIDDYNAAKEYFMALCNNMGNLEFAQIHRHYFAVYNKDKVLSFNSENREVTVEFTNGEDLILTKSSSSKKERELVVENLLNDDYYVWHSNRHEYYNLNKLCGTYVEVDEEYEGEVYATFEGEDNHMPIYTEYYDDATSQDEILERKKRFEEAVDNFFKKVKRIEARKFLHSELDIDKIIEQHG